MLSTLLVYVWRGRICDHVGREDVVKGDAAVVSSSSSPRLRFGAVGGRGRCVFGGDGRALASGAPSWGIGVSFVVCEHEGTHGWLDKLMGRRLALGKGEELSWHTYGIVEC